MDEDMNDCLFCHGDQCRCDGVPGSNCTLSQRGTRLCHMYYKDTGVAERVYDLQSGRGKPKNDCIFLYKNRCWCDEIPSNHCRLTQEDAHLCVMYHKSYGIPEDERCCQSERGDKTCGNCYHWAKEAEVVFESGSIYVGECWLHSPGEDFKDSRMGAAMTGVELYKKGGSPVMITSEEFSCGGWFDKQEAFISKDDEDDSKPRSKPDLVFFDEFQEFDQNLADMSEDTEEEDTSVEDTEEEVEKDNSGKSPALQRGMEMMKTPLGELPWLAVEYMRQLSREAGFCGEMCLAAWCIYKEMSKKAHVL